MSYVSMTEAELQEMLENDRAADNWRLVKEATIRSSQKRQPGRLNMIDDSDLLQVITMAMSDYFRMADELRTAKQELSAAVEAAAIGEAIRAALNGEPVSDFMESFPDVRHAQETYEQAWRYRDLCD